MPKGRALSKDGSNWNMKAGGAFDMEGACEFGEGEGVDCGVGCAAGGALGLRIAMGDLVGGGGAAVGAGVVDDDDEEGVVDVGRPADEVVVGENEFVPFLRSASFLLLSASSRLYASSSVSSS